MGNFTKRRRRLPARIDIAPATPEAENMAFDRDQMKKKAAALAAKGVYIGTSSWKYEGWFGQLYTPARYEYRGKVAKTRFERDCLSEYAEVFQDGERGCGVLHDFPARNISKSWRTPCPMISDSASR